MDNTGERGDAAEKVIIILSLFSHYFALFYLGSLCAICVMGYLGSLCVKRVMGYGLWVIPYMAYGLPP